MKNENKCFFSVSLKNGITITGENPHEVQHFVLDLQLACHDSMNWTKQESDEMNTWCETMYEYEGMFHNAWFTIYKNMKGE